ncbi:hypothetical protein ACHAQA_003840 [Verticillium albo-atrum]
MHKSHCLRQAFGLAKYMLLTLGAAQEVTQGPLGPVSLGSYTELATARACAAGCLVFNGIWVCGVNAGYDDLGVALECGCASVNGCYCNTGLASSATSYLSRCISSRCADSVDNWTDEVSGMLGIYDGYCATALEGGAATTAKTTAEATTNTAETTDALRSTPTTGGAAQTSGNSAQETSTSDNDSTADGKTDEKGSGSDGGLSRSDIVALAASLGVGIPSLIIAAITLCFQMKKKRRNAVAAAASEQQTMIHVVPYTGTPTDFPLAGKADRPPTGKPTESPQAWKPADTGYQGPYGTSELPYNGMPSELPGNNGWRRDNY